MRVERIEEYRRHGVGQGVEMVLPPNLRAWFSLDRGTYGLEHEPQDNLNHNESYSVWSICSWVLPE